jgi:glycosyltransferase involved in cell wall biosynthesis
MKKGFSVIMPICNQASFIRRAIPGLQRQTCSQWELIIINDGCSDETEFFIPDFLSDFFYENRLETLKQKLSSISSEE